MLILALDTTTRGGSCALARDDRILCEQASDSSRPQAARLPGELAALLDREHVALADIDAFAVAIGPGSFTGLRVGIATLQGLALAMEKPLVGVSALDALAAMANGTSVATWVDAWRGEVYGAYYRGGQPVDAPIVAPPALLLESIDGARTVFIGDGAAAYREIIMSTLGGRAQFSDPLVPLLASTIAQLAAPRLRAGDRPSPDAIRPLYVRRPDAEIARDARRS